MSEESSGKDKKHVFDKVIMGAIVGGAIGSVMGANQAKNRASKSFFSKIKKLCGGKDENTEG